MGKLLTSLTIAFLTTSSLVARASNLTPGTSAPGPSMKAGSTKFAHETTDQFVSNENQSDHHVIQTRIAELQKTLEDGQNIRSSDLRAIRKAINDYGNCNPNRYEILSALIQGWENLSLLSLSSNPPEILD